MNLPATAHEFAGAVLAGGSSRRMGTDKAFVVIDGRPMVARTVDALAAAGAEPVVVVGGDAGRLAGLGLSTVPDRAPGQGPLQAVITALTHLAGAEVIVVLGCDLLDPAPHTITALVAALHAAPDAAVAVPVVDHRAQWAHAAWRRSRALTPMIDAAARGERSLRGSLNPHLIVEVEGLEPSTLADADRPHDLPPGRAFVGGEPATG